jgi:hypothetical protein
LFMEMSQWNTLFNYYIIIKMLFKKWKKSLAKYYYFQNLLASQFGIREIGSFLHKRLLSGLWVCRPTLWPDVEWWWLETIKLCLFWLMLLYLSHLSICPAYEKLIVSIGLCFITDFTGRV